LIGNPRIVGYYYWITIYYSLCLLSCFPTIIKNYYNKLLQTRKEKLFSYLLLSIAVIITLVSHLCLHNHPIVLLSHNTLSSGTYLSKFPIYKPRQSCDCSSSYTMSYPNYIISRLSVILSAKVKIIIHIASLLGLFPTSYWLS